MSIENVRFEVMQTLEKSINSFVDRFLTAPDKIWQPSDLLPDPTADNFIEEVKEIRELSKELGDDFWVVMVGDMVTEEALPTYESWLMDMDGVNQHHGEVRNERDNGWAKWIRAWTAEENRHGDVLNKYLYLSGRINMREVEVSTQHLIADGFDAGTAQDPYKNFVFTSFQELATFVSHNNTANMARNAGHKALAKMCKQIAGDEMRHHVAYSEFVKQIFKYDPSEMMKAFHHMMKTKITMPAMNVRNSFGSKGDLFDQFSIAAQRIGVYTSFDYVDILKKLNKMWDIENINGLTDEAERARDYLAKLPERMYRLAERAVLPDTKYDWKWITPAMLAVQFYWSGQVRAIEMNWSTCRTEP